MEGKATVTARRATLETTRLFTEALNARDLEALRDFVTQDAEFPSPQGRVLTGYDGLKGLVKAATDTDLLLARRGPEQVEDDSSAERVTVPVRVVVRKSDLQGDAMFAVRDGRVAMFEVVTRT